MLNRLVDYVGLDLSRAVRVGQLVGAVNTPFKTQSTFLVTETNTLTINIPDYYGSNTPTKTAGSSLSRRKPVCARFSRGEWIHRLGRCGRHVQRRSIGAIRAERERERRDSKFATTEPIVP